MSGDIHKLSADYFHDELLYCVIDNMSKKTVEKKKKNHNFLEPK